MKRSLRSRILWAVVIGSQGVLAPASLAGEAPCVYHGEHTTHAGPMDTGMQPGGAAAAADHGGMGADHAAPADADGHTGTDCTASCCCAAPGVQPSAIGNELDGVPTEVRAPPGLTTVSHVPTRCRYTLPFATAPPA